MAPCTLAGDLQLLDGAMGGVSRSGLSGYVTAPREEYEASAGRVLQVKERTTATTSAYRTTIQDHRRRRKCGTTNAELMPPLTIVGLKRCYGDKAPRKNGGSVGANVHAVSGSRPGALSQAPTE